MAKRPVKRKVIAKKAKAKSKTKKKVAPVKRTPVKRTPVKRAPVKRTPVKKTASPVEAPAQRQRPVVEQSFPPPPPPFDAFDDPTEQLSDRDIVGVIEEQHVLDQLSEPKPR